MIATALISALLAADPDPAALTAFNVDRLHANKVSMFVLGSWAAANIATSAIGWAASKDDRWKGIFQMSLAWGVVNLGLAIAALAMNWHTDPASLDFKTSLGEGVNIEKIFAVNVGLDVAYMIGGGFLWYRGDVTAKQQMIGWGQAVLVQGAFLFLFDAAMFLVNNRIDSRAWAMFPR